MSGLDTFASSLSEWHALVVGLAVGVLFGLNGGLLFAVAALAVVLVALDVVSGLKVVDKEPWYALAGLTVGYYAGTLAPTAIPA